MIRIVNWLLTRKCNLLCNYCAIIRNYVGMPSAYPELNYYLKEEMTTYQVLMGLDRFKNHNPDCFHIFYGGEPMLRKDLPEIIEHCNTNNIHYTIISNNTKEVQPAIKKLIKKVEVRGFTASIDPALVGKTPDYDRLRKSEEGFKSLLNLKNYIKDVVAEVTIMKEDVTGIYEIVKHLSDHGINSDLTFVDIAKTPYYDFSNLRDTSYLVKPEYIIHKQFQDIIKDSSFDVHMKNVLLPIIWKSLPSNYDCKLEDGVHNISIDADGQIRLCLRIRGTFEKRIDMSNLLKPDFSELSEYAFKSLVKNKKQYCRLCNHTCQMMSKYIDEENKIDSLIHKDKRGG